MFVTTIAFLSMLSEINITAIITVLTICLSAMATLIKVFGPSSRISDEVLRDSEYLKSIAREAKDKADQIEKDSKEKTEKFLLLKDSVHLQAIEIEKLKVETHNTSKGVDELKKDNSYLVQRLDNLLKQFMEYMEG